jgi:hypothetical protein
LILPKNYFYTPHRKSRKLKGDSYGGNGKLIALEGDYNILATQLRLLPPSKKFLIIPSIFETSTDKHEFDARSYVRQVHIAFAERTERARSFLQSSTSEHPRLAFMNGGSVSARSTCIARICEYVTDGHVREAENVFNKMVKYGVAGLMKDASENDMQPEKDGTNRDGKRVEKKESPSLKAMKAADSPERDTVIIQLDVIEGLVDLPSQTPAKVGKQCPEGTLVHRQEIFTTEHSDEIIRTEVTIPRQRGTLLGKRGTFGLQYEIAEHDSYADISSPGEDSLISVPPTPAVIFGEVCLVDMGSTPPKTVKRAQSVDRFYPSNSEFLEPHSSPRPLKHTTSAYHLRMRPTNPEGMLQPGHGGFPTLPRTTFVKASETTIRKSLTSGGSLASSSFVDISAPRVFVDRGTDVEDATEDAVRMGDTVAVNDASLESEPFLPVFPVVEDFILHLHDGRTNEILESVIRSSKDGSDPAIPSSNYSSPLSEGFGSSITLELASSLQHSSILRPTSHFTEEVGEMSHGRRHEFDPYALHGDYPPDVKQQWPQDRHSSANNAASTNTPPTPTMTPPPTNGIADKSVEFSPVNTGNAINVQILSDNCLAPIFQLESIANIVTRFALRQIDSGDLFSKTTKAQTMETREGMLIRYLPWVVKKA